MRMSQLFSRTQRDTPGDTETISQQLLWRAGYLRRKSAGNFIYLPLGFRALKKIEANLRDEMVKIGGQEIGVPGFRPRERSMDRGQGLFSDAQPSGYQDRYPKSLSPEAVLNEAIQLLVRNEIRSYRQLPQIIYYLQIQWMEDGQARYRIMSPQTFTMLNSISLNASGEGVMKQYDDHYRSFMRVFGQANLPVTTVEADIRGSSLGESSEIVYLTPYGDEDLIFCTACDYKATRRTAKTKKPLPNKEEFLTVDKVATPECKSIEELANYLEISKTRTAKAIFLMATLLENNQNKDQFVFAVVRGDMEVNESKLAALIHSLTLRPASEQEIKSAGAIPGYASPVGIKNALVVVDDLIPNSPNLVSGANEVGFHLRNVNYGRDYRADLVADITLAQEGDRCPHCEAPLKLERGVMLAFLSRLERSLSESMDCCFLDDQGRSMPIYFGSYGVNLDRVLACAAQTHHDDHGLILPMSVAPYQVQLVVLRGKNDSTAFETAEQIYSSLQAQGIEVLYDDRQESPGVKFNDADLIGLPVRLTVSERGMSAGGLEFKLRGQSERSVIPLDQALIFVGDEISKIYAQAA